MRPAIPMSRSIRALQSLRAVQAATNHTEGQRMLQAGFDGEILGGESREKSDVDGAPTPDIEMATKTEFTTLGTHVMLNKKPARFEHGHNQAVA